MGKAGRRRGICQARGCLNPCERLYCQEHRSEPNRLARLAYLKARKPKPGKKHRRTEDLPHGRAISLILGRDPWR